MKQLAISILAVTVLAAALPALADPPHRHRPDRGWEGKRDIRHFHTHHYDTWRKGKWRNVRHDGRLGWWWVVGGMWYFYPKPVYPYPDPYVPPVVLMQQIPAPAPQPAVQPVQNWYYCEASKGYYPYVSSCPDGWKAVPATPPDAPAK